MTTPADMIRRFEAFDFANEMSIICERHKYVLAEANKMQWKLGVRTTGQPIGKYKNGMYAFFKNQKNPLAGVGNMDLIDTGETVNSITVDVTKDSLIFKLGSDRYEWEGRKDHLLGLTTNSIKAFIDVYALPELIESFKKHTGATS